jgi:hypothetical protein
MKTLSLFLATLIVGAVQIGSAQITPHPMQKPSFAADRMSLTPADKLRQDVRKLWSIKQFTERFSIAS